MLNLLKNYDHNSDALFYHRMTEAFKFAYAKRSRLGDEGTPDIIKMMENLQSQEYADEVRKLINDTTTSHNASYYGADFDPPKDRGTGHISIIMPNGDAISATSTINYKFGAFWRSKSTGFILNNEMNDFSTPGEVNVYGIPSSPSNYIRAGKTPLSSMSPSILVDEGGHPR